MNSKYHGLVYPNATYFVRVDNGRAVSGSVQIRTVDGLDLYAIWGITPGSFVVSFGGGSFVYDYPGGRFTVRRFERFVLPGLAGRLRTHMQTDTYKHHEYHLSIVCSKCGDNPKWCLCPDCIDCITGAVCTDCGQCPYCCPGYHVIGATYE